MQQPIAAQNFPAVDIKRAAAKIRDLTAGFLHQQNARRGVPRIQIKFPISVKAAAGQVTQIQRSGTGTTDSMRSQRDLVIEVNVWVFMALVAGKTGGYQTFFKVANGRNMDEAA